MLSLQVVYARYLLRCEYRHVCCSVCDDAWGGGVLTSSLCVLWAVYLVCTCVYGLSMLVWCLLVFVVVHWVVMCCVLVAYVIAWLFVCVV